MVQLAIAAAGKWAREARIGDHHVLGVLDLFYHWRWLDVGIGMAMQRNRISYYVGIFHLRDSVPRGFFL